MKNEAPTTSDLFPVELRSVPLGGELSKDKYRTIVIDPPWPVAKIDRDLFPNQAELGYPTMSVEAIGAIKIPKIAARESHLYLWTTQKFLRAAFDILDGWGFEYLVTMVWHKSGGFQPFRLPQYNCEFVLLGRKGELPFETSDGFQCCFGGKRREHSRKPEAFREMIEVVSPTPRLELFGRPDVPGWWVWGPRA